MSMNIDVRAALRHASLTCSKCLNTAFTSRYIASDGTVIKEWAVGCETHKVLCSCQRKVYDTFGEPVEETKKERYNRSA